MIIGVTGYAQVGKDTLANELVRCDRFHRVAFADAMRNVLYALNPIIEVPRKAHLNGMSWLVGGTHNKRLAEIIDQYGWDVAKVEHPEIRNLLQRLGTDGGRKHLGEDIWVRTALDNQQVERLVVPDVRFPDEAEAIKERGGFIVRITREGYGAINGHISEVAYQDQDFTIPNNRTPEDLHQNFRIALASFQQSQQP